MKKPIASFSFFYYKFKSRKHYVALQTNWDGLWDPHSAKYMWTRAGIVEQIYTT